MPHVVVTLTDEADLSRVSQALARAGLVAAEPLAELGMVMGEAPDACLAALRAVPGVRDVEASGEVSVPSPDSPLQ